MKPALAQFVLVAAAVLGLPALAARQTTQPSLTPEKLAILELLEVTRVPTAEGGWRTVLRVHDADLHVEGCLTTECGTPSGPTVVVEPLEPAPTRSGRLELPPRVVVKAGGEYFTRSTLYAARRRWTPANYRDGVLVPINTRVRVEFLSATSITVQDVHTRERLTFENADRYSGMTLQQLAQSLLAEEPTNLTQTAFGEAIRRGQLAAGMSKEEVVLARGLPPRHRTANTEENRWTYWDSPIVQFDLEFEGGKLTKLPGRR